MAEIKPLYKNVGREMRVAGFMSGSGTNLRKIIEYERGFDAQGHAGFTDGKSCPYHVAVIFSDNPKSKAVEIGSQFDIPVIVRDIESYYKHREVSMRNLGIRKDFDGETFDALSSFDVSVLALAGYMKRITSPLIENFLAVNVHPADLSIKDKQGKRKYTGDNAVRGALLAGEKEIRATTHVVEDKVDYGRILMVSKPINIDLAYEFTAAEGTHQLNMFDVINKVAARNQDRLKAAGDWQIFPKTLELIADGKFQEDENGNLYFDGKAIPQGVRL